MADEPNLTIVPSYDALSRLAADVVMETVSRLPEAAIAVPTGNTPRGMYRELARRASRNEVDFSRVHVFCLDEYLGVPPEDPNSLIAWLGSEFVLPARVHPAHVHPVPAAEPDPDVAGARYEAELAAHGGLELAVLGLGPNGHVAYNEPGSIADSRTRPVELTAESIAQASTSWYGSRPVPRRAMTMGIGTLLEARRIVLIVSGEGKAEMLCRALRDPMTPEVPASWLRLAGARLTVITDEAAAHRLV